jgi:hypothetical protein
VDYLRLNDLTAPSKDGSLSDDDPGYLEALQRKADVDQQEELKEAQLEPRVRERVHECKISKWEGDPQTDDKNPALEHKAEGSKTGGQAAKGKERHSREVEDDSEWEEAVERMLQHPEDLRWRERKEPYAHVLTDEERSYDLTTTEATHHQKTTMSLYD